VILGAALLVLVALGLFVGGVATGATAFYWACVAVSLLAAVLLVVARRRMGRTPDEEQVDDRPAPPAAAPQRDADHPAEDGAGRVSAPEQQESADKVSGATATGATATDAMAAGRTPERPDGAVEKRPVAPLPADDGGEPPVEEVEVSDLLLVVDLRDDVLVVDEHPRYHVEGCPWLAGRTTIPLPLDEARADGFTPCARCAPDRHLAGIERARRAERRAT